MLAISAALGATTIAYPSRLRGKHILVTNCSSPVGQGLHHILTALNIHHDSVDDKSRVSRGALPYDIILSGFNQKEELQLLRCAARSCSSIFLWNDPTCGIRAVLDKQVWAVADALNMLKHLPKIVISDLISPIRALESILDTAPVTVTTRLFDPLKVYLLVGGVGSLGMSIALWMYKNGARRIVITSRNGVKSSSLTKNENALRILKHIQNLHDLTLRIESCDATSIDDMKTLISSITGHIGGCMLLSALLSDKTFFAHTAETYYVPFGPKVMALKVLEQAVNIMELDFLVTFSSGTIFGNAGQTNYSSANTSMDELTRRYPNAFSIVTPLVFDSTIAVDSSSKLKNTLSTWGVSSDLICDYIKDGLLKLADGPFWLYIPDMDWATVERSLGPSSLYSHLVTSTDDMEQRLSDGPPLSLKEIVLSHIDVGPEDLSPSVPLTSYGLDSISAARLSYDLRSLISVSQLQLLADISLEDLELRLHDTSKKNAVASRRPETEFNWVDLNKSGETIVKLRDLDGNPLILVHGASGNVVAFRPLQERFSTPLWAIQTTPETPMHSIPAMAKFYFEQIKKERPQGPYRIAGYSGTCLITFELARLFESSGDTIAQLAFLDHFPMLFCSPMWTWDDDTIRQVKASHALVAQQIFVLCTAIRGDRTANRHNVADGLIDALNGKDVSPQIKHYHDTVKIMVDIVVSFLLDLAGGDAGAVMDSLTSWMQRIGAPLTVYVASKGILLALSPEEQVSWADFGARVAKDAKVITIEGDHFGFLESESFLHSIQFDWSG